MMIMKHGSDGDGMQMMGEETVVGTRSKKDEMPAEGLKLDISDSFLSYTKLMLAWHKSVAAHNTYNTRSKFEELKTAQSQIITAERSKKIPAVMPLLTLSIANKKFIRTDECDILALFCCRTKKVVCQNRDKKLSWKLEIPFSDITSLLVCFDNENSDTLAIEAKSSFKSCSADKPRPGKFHYWKVDDSKDDYCLPESKFIFLEIEKGVLDKSLAKMLYTDPRLLRAVRFAREDFDDRHMYQDGTHAHMQETNMFALHHLPSDNVFPFN
ncbi:hypothetical protein ACP70R_024811 [Stipagrostis hirtigluma subsp. patula]